MKKLFYCADRYIQECDWRDLAAIKFCLASIGFLIGLTVPAQKRTLPCLLAFSVFLATYLPLMKKFYDVVQAVRSEER